MAIEMALTLRLLLDLPLRQTEGFIASIFELLDLHLDAPDHTTLSRRGERLSIPPRPRRSETPTDLVIDSSGLAIFGEGEWAAEKHGGSGVQGWRKLHLGVDVAGFIVAETPTDANTDDANTGIDLIDEVPGDINALIGDAAYDTRPFYDAGEIRQTTVVVPPRCADRDRTINRVRDVGRRQ